MGRFVCSAFVSARTRLELELVASLVAQDGLDMVGLDVVLVRVGSDVLVKRQVGEEVHVVLSG